MRATIDRLGRVAFVCDGCARRRAGICAMCPCKVSGTIGKTKYCVAHRKLAKLTHNDRWLAANREERNTRARMRKRINPRVALTPRQAGKRGGMVGGKRRAEALSPQQRSAIARQAALARWRHYAAVA